MRSFLTTLLFVLFCVTTQAQQLQGRWWGSGQALVDTRNPANWRLVPSIVNSSLPGVPQNYNVFPISTFSDSTGELIGYMSLSRVLHDNMNSIVKFTTINCQDTSLLNTVRLNEFSETAPSSYIIPSKSSCTNERATLIVPVISNQRLGGFTNISSIRLRLVKVFGSDKINSVQIRKKSDSTKVFSHTSQFFFRDINYSFQKSSGRYGAFIPLYGSNKICVFSFSNSDNTRDSVEVFDVNNFSRSDHLAVAANQQKLAVITESKVYLCKLDTVTNFITDTISIDYIKTTYANGSQSAGICFSPSGRYLYISGLEFNNIPVVPLYRFDLSIWNRVSINRSIAVKNINTRSLVYNKYPYDLVNSRSQSYSCQMQMTSFGNILVNQYSTLNSQQIDPLRDKHWFASIDCPDSPTGLQTMRDSVDMQPITSRTTPFPPLLSTIAVRNAGIFQITASRRRFCLGDSIRLQGYGATTTAVSWSGPPGLSDTQVWDPMFKPLAPGVYTFTATGTSQCTTATATISVEVLPKPVPPVVPAQRFLCPGDSLTITLPPPSAGITYTWSTGQQGNVVTFNRPGNYIVFASNAACAVASDTIRVVPADSAGPPTLSILGASTLCPGDSTTLTASALSNNNLPLVSYRWFGPGIGIPRTGSIRAGRAGFYSVQGITAQGCTTAVSNVVAVQVRPQDPAPPITLQNQGTLCEGDTATLTGPVTDGNTVVAYRWSTGDTTRSIRLTTSQTVSLVTVNATGCQSATATRSVVINPKPRPLLEGLESICPGTPALTYRLVADANPLQATSIRFTITGGQVIQTAADSIVVLWNLGATQRSIAATATGQNGCAAIISPLVINQSTVLQPAAIRGSTALCYDALLQPYTTLPVPNGTYTWQVTGGNIVQGQGSRQVTVQWLAGNQPRQLQYTLEVRNVDSLCRGTSNPIQIQVLPEPARPTLISQSLTPACERGSWRLSTVLPNPVQQHSWTLPATLTLDSGSLNSPTIRVIAGPTTSTQILSYQYRYLDSAGCWSATEADSLVLFATPPAPTIATTDSLTCAGGSITYVASTASQDPTNPVVDYRWLSQSTGNRLSTGPTYTTTDTSLTIAVVAITSNGCLSPPSISPRLRWRPTPPIGLLNPERYFCPESPPLTYRATAGYTTYNWLVTGGTVVSNYPNEADSVRIMWDEQSRNRSLSVRIQNQFGCENTSQAVSILFDSLAADPNSNCDIRNFPIKAPNVITPNGDGINDVFIIDRAALYPDARLRIFNRYGVVVHESMSLLTPWSATGLPAGTYFYLIQGSRVKASGWLEVVR